MYDVAVNCRRWKSRCMSPTMRLHEYARQGKRLQLVEPEAFDVTLDIARITLYGSIDLSSYVYIGLRTKRRVTPPTTFTHSTSKEPFHDVGKRARLLR